MLVGVARSILATLLHSFHLGCANRPFSAAVRDTIPCRDNLHWYTRLHRHTEYTRVTYKFAANKKKNWCTWQDDISGPVDTTGDLGIGILTTLYILYMWAVSPPAGRTHGLVAGDGEQERVLAPRNNELPVMRVLHDDNQTRDVASPRRSSARSMKVVRAHASYFDHDVCSRYPSSSLMSGLLQGSFFTCGSSASRPRAY